MNEITIFATDDTAKKFLLFQKYFDIFNVLLENNIFEQKKATIALNFDHNGILQSVQRADFLYTKKFST